ncbi:MAG: tRNA (guanosine(46)-N7)-methyltransferase TrmB [Planctomycetia bacterium]|nr:tRNA (guanosine(46)-N7)-methyltransferase TrmB [Planctomycetia bacterium]
MRKPRRLSTEELAPWVWPTDRGQRSEDRSQKTEVRDQKSEDTEQQTESAQVSSVLASDLCSLSSVLCPLPAIEWRVLFGNANPVEIEVGTGKGLFLLNSAMSRPDTNFFGIEIVRKFQLYAATRFAIRNLPNVKIACADAKVILRDCVPPGSVAAVHVYFPDPWWKKRHKKRRVFTPEFAADVARALAVGGRLLIASDVEEYFGVMTEIVCATGSFVERPEEVERAAPRTEAGYATNFERKAREKGTGVWRAVYQRTA